MPNDPSAGFIEVQGHPLVHFAFFVALIGFVQVKGETFCFERNQNGTWTKLTSKSASGSTADQIDGNDNFVAEILKWMHLVIAILLLFGLRAPQKKQNMNLYVFKKLMVFVCAPAYVFVILMCQYFVFFDRVWYKAGSTKTDFTLAYPLCVSQHEGNLHEWLLIEIYAFYTNLIVLIVLLAHSRCTKVQETNLEMDLEDI